MTSPTFQTEWDISMDGSPLDDAVANELIDLRVERTLQLADMCVARFMDPDFEIVDGGTFAVGSTLSVTLTSMDGVSGTVFDGEVTAIAVDPAPSGHNELVVTGFDRSHRLARGVQVRTFTEQTDSDIVSTIAGEVGLRVSADSTTTEHAFMLQQETNAAFLSRRAYALGFRWWVEGTTLNFKEIADAEAGATLTMGQDLRSFRVRMTAGDNADSVVVRAWDPVNQQSIVSSQTPAATTGNGLASDASGATAVATDAAGFGTSERFVGGTSGDATQATALATSIGKRVVSTQVSARGVCSLNPSVVAGAAVTVEGVGAMLSGDYVVTRVEHVISAGADYETRFSCEGIDTADLAGLLGPPPPPPPTSGLMVGKVTNINNDAAASQVKVKLPALSDDDESAWARIVMPGAGAERGLHVLPEIDDEVVVGFEQGDPTRPFVLGGLWSGNAAPPSDNATAIDGSQVKVRSWKTRRGHHVTITDIASGEGNKIEVVLGNGKGSVTVADDGITVATKGDLTMTADGAISLDAGGDISMSGANIKIAGKTKVDIKANQVAAKADTSAAFEGTTTNVKASATLNLEGSATAALKGGMVNLN